MRSDTVLIYRWQILTNDLSNFIWLRRHPAKVVVFRVGAHLDRATNVIALHQRDEVPTTMGRSFQYVRYATGAIASKMQQYMALLRNNRFLLLRMPWPASRDRHAPFIALLRISVEERRP